MHIIYEFSVVCPDIGYVNRGHVSYSNSRYLDSVATITCGGGGYRIAGHQTLTCHLDGSWSHKKPRCVQSN